MNKNNSKRNKTPQVTARHIAEATASWPIAVPEIAHAPLAMYITLLMQWNRVMNLVGARHWQECLHNLMVDSFFLEKFLRTLPPVPKDAHIWDLGAGAGLPGIALRMLWQEGHYHLIESREKRAIFLSNVLAQCNAMQSPLKQTTVYRGRAEDFFAEQKAQGIDAHMIVSRAFMPFAQLLEFVKDHLTIEGRVVFMTLEKAPDAILAELGWLVESESSYVIQGQKRYFWSIVKAG